MKSNPYPPYDDEPMRAAEPAVAYGNSATTVNEHRCVYQVTEAERARIMLARDQFSRGEYYTEDEMDKMVKEWLN